jgi:flagellar protein FlgJ
MATTPLPVTSSVDLRGLERLRFSAANDDPAALAEAAVQFEALFIGMMLDSARSASLGEGLFDGPQTQQYLELMDQQVALEMARRGGFGFGKMLMQQLANRDAAASSPPAGPLPITPADTRPPMQLPAPLPPLAEPASAAPTGAFPRGLPASLEALGGAAESSSSGAANDADEADAKAADFVSRFLPEARKAAEALGIEPRLLLAQAALETGWGKSLGDNEAARSNNLFGIKTGSSWQGPSVARWTLEHADGVALRKHEQFRAYEDASASFADYVELIGNSPRYAAALEQGGDARAYAHAVAEAGYATDPAYASKWLAIYHGDRLGGALRAVDTAVPRE